MKRVLSLVLALVMVLGMIPTFAAEMTGAEHLKEHGFISGGTNGDLMEANKLTREQLAAVMSQLYGEEDQAAIFAQPADYSDWAKVADWAKPYVAYNEVNGWMQGNADGSFNPQGIVSAQQLAALLLKVLGYDFTWSNALAVAGSKGLVIDGAELTRGQAFDAIWTAVSEVKLAGEEQTLGVKLGKLDPPTPPVAPAELVVKGVSVMNAKQIKITFGDAVLEETVLNSDGEIVGDSVKINDSSLGFTGEFNDELTELVLTKDSGTWNKNQVYVVSVTGVRNDKWELVPAFATALTMVETEVPSVVSAKSITKDLVTRSVTLTFSEPVTFTSIRIDGKFAAVTTADNSFGAKWTLTAAADLEVGSSYAIEINNLRDMFDNRAEALTNYSVVVERDNVKPVISGITPVGERTFDITFNKPMSASVGVDSIGVTKVTNGNTITLGQANLAVRRANLTTFRVTLADVAFDSATQQEKEITVAIKGLQDTLGNVMEATSQKLVLVRDVVKPTISSVQQKLGTQTSLIVTFSENVRPVASNDFNANPATIFAVRNLDGSAVTVSGSTITVTGAASATVDSRNRVEITLSAALPTSGEYRLVLVQNSIQDTANGTPNRNDAQLVTFGYSKSAAVIQPVNATILGVYNNTSMANVTESGDSSKRAVYIHFDRADIVNDIDLSTGSYKNGAADNPANYTLNGAALPAGTVVTFLNDNADNGGNDAVKLDFSAVTNLNLPTALKAGGQISVAVSNVMTAQGATLTYTTAAITVKDTTAPTIASSFVTGNAANGYTITLVMSEGIAAVSTAAVADFGYSIDGVNDLVEFSTTNNTLTRNADDHTRLYIEVKNATDVAALAAAFAAPQEVRIGSRDTGAAITAVVDKATVANALVNGSAANLTGTVLLQLFVNTPATVVTTGITSDVTVNAEITLTFASTAAPATATKVAYITKTGTTTYTVQELPSASKANAVAITATNTVTISAAANNHVVALMFLDANDNVVGYWLSGTLTTN